MPTDKITIIYFPRLPSHVQRQYSIWNTDVATSRNWIMVVLLWSKRNCPCYDAIATFIYCVKKTALLLPIVITKALHFILWYLHPFHHGVNVEGGDWLWMTMDCDLCCNRCVGLAITCGVCAFCWLLSCIVCRDSWRSAEMMLLLCVDM